MGKKGPLWGSSAANQILLRHSGPILSATYYHSKAIAKYGIIVVLQQRNARKHRKLSTVPQNWYAGLSEIFLGN